MSKYFMDPNGLTIIVPCYNEVESIPLLYYEIEAVLKGVSVPAEILFVDDGSSDGTWQEIVKISNGDARARGIRLRRNYGKTAALSVAFKEASGGCVVTMDADLQDDPREIPRMLKYLEEGFDLISGWKKVRHDPWHKTLPSRVFNAFIRVSTELKLHDINCGLKCYRRAVVLEIPLFGDLHRFIPILAKARGFRVGEMEVNHRVRSFGTSKYGIGRFVKGTLDLLTVLFMTKFLQKPLQCLGTIGILFLSLGFCELSYLGGLWLAGGGPIGTRPLLTYSMGALLFGTQLLSLGFLAELITWRAEGSSGAYSVESRTQAPRIKSKAADSLSTNE